MTNAEIIELLRKAPRAQVSRQTGLKYGYLSKVVYGEILNPGSQQMDKLRHYFQQRATQ